MLSRHFLLYGLAGLVLAAATFFTTRAFVINQAPKSVMSHIESRIVKGADGWNACYHNRDFGPRLASARRANPDSIISSMAYDLSDGPVRISGEVWPKYWSLSLYQQNSDNFFVINDRQMENPEFDFIILSDKNASLDTSAYPDVKKIVSPTEKGIALIRRFAASETDMPAIRANQDALYCGSAE